MKKIAVIGGGLAGLASTVYLTDHNFTVHLYEASPKLGGRAYSFHFNPTNEFIDNGQHLMMGCYDYTLEFVKKIGAIDSLFIQDNLLINIIEKNHVKYKLNASAGFYPFNILFALANYEALNWVDRLKIIKLISKLLFYPTDSLNNYSVKEWLIKEKQTERSMEALWEIIAVGALNSGIEKSSARIFADILKQIFLRNNKSTVLILPKQNLNHSFCLPAENFIKQKGGQIFLSSGIDEILFENNEVKGLRHNNKMEEYDFIVSAVPLNSLKKIISPESINKLELPDLTYSPILNVHLWLDNNTFKEKFYGLINSDIHWIFNHGHYISITISDAQIWMDIDPEIIVEKISVIIKEFFPYFDQNSIKHFKVIKEKKATFIPDKASLKNRPSTRTKIKNFFLAGDWTNTKLPATIEGAIKSGKTATDEIILQN